MESFGRLVILFFRYCALHIYRGGFLAPFMEFFVKSLQLFREFFLFFGVFHLTKFIIYFFYFSELICKVFFLF